jgi:DNA-binding Xre family transcriptional regulator
MLLEAGLLYLLRGDLSGLLIPLADFSPGPGSPKPNFKRFSVTDHGQTLVFGKFEAAFDAVLYEHDRRFRRRLRARMSASDRSLGASLRRLRKQMGLRLQDFGPLEKTLARIERGQVTRPRRSTLELIAQRLGCSVEELGSY